MAVTIIAASIVEAMIIGINNSQNLQKANDTRTLSTCKKHNNTFVQNQIVVNQEDKVTLHFIGLQGAHRVITVDGVGNFELMRGQINTV